MTSWKQGADDRGFALVMVLWAITVLALLAGTFSAAARTEMGLARNAVANAKAEALADAGVYRAISDLLEADGAAAVRVDGRVLAWRFGDGEVRYSVTDENGKIDLNLAEPDLLARLFESVGASPETGRALAGAIADRRGIEDDSSLRNSPANGTKGAPFELIEELRNIDGMTPQLFERVAPFITVHADDAVPQPSVAAPLIRALLAGWASDTTMSNTDLQTTGLAGGGNAGTASPDDSAGVDVNQDAPLSSIYTIRSEARTLGDAVFARIAVVSLSDVPGNAYEFHRWRQGTSRLFPAPE